MKVAVIGSRGITDVNIEEHLPKTCTEIVSGGARGVDTLAAGYAREKGLKLTVFLPDYDKYARGAPLVRNKQIVDYCDLVLAFWDGSSRGTAFVIDYCKKTGTPYKVITQ